MSRRTLAAALVTALTLAQPASALAAMNVVVDGKPLAFDVAPVVENGRSLVPLRAIFEALGADIAFDGATQTITAYQPERRITVQLRVGENTATVNGETVTLELPAKAIEGRTMVPLRFISTAMGASVTWDAATETAHIVQTAPEPAPAGDTGSPETAPAADAKRDLNRYVRLVAREYEPALEDCGRELQFESESLDSTLDYANPVEDAEWKATRVAEYIACTDELLTVALPGLAAPASAEAAHGALVKRTQAYRDAYQTIYDAHQAYVRGEVDQALELRARVRAEIEALEAATSAVDAAFERLGGVMTLKEHRLIHFLGGPWREFMGSCAGPSTVKGAWDEQRYDEVEALVREAYDCLTGEREALWNAREISTPRMEALATELENALIEYRDAFVMLFDTLRFVSDGDTEAAAASYAEYEGARAAAEAGLQTALDALRTYEEMAEQ